MSVLASPEYVSEGSRMTWTGQFSSFLMMASETPNDAVSKVAASLKNMYNLIVEKSENGISWLGAGGGSITLYLRSDMDRGDGEQDDGLSDILGNVNAAFDAINCPVITAVINDYTPADTGAIQKTGVPLATVTEQQRQDAANNPPSGNSWWDNITGKLEAGSIGIVIGGAAVVVVLIVLLTRPSVGVSA